MNELGFGNSERDLRMWREEEDVMRFWFPREYILHNENVTMKREIRERGQSAIQRALRFEYERATDENAFW